MSSGVESCKYLKYVTTTLLCFILILHRHTPLLTSCRTPSWQEMAELVMLFLLAISFAGLLVALTICSIFLYSLGFSFFLFYHDRARCHCSYKKKWTTWYCSEQPDCVAPSAIEIRTHHIARLHFIRKKLAEPLTDFIGGMRYSGYMYGN